MKINEEEAMHLRNNGLLRGSSFNEMVRYLTENYNLKACCITFGERGAIGGNENDIVKVGGIRAKTGGDTVGCGDAFSAIWLANLLKGKTMEESLSKANEIGSRVASEKGAITEI